MHIILEKGTVNCLHLHESLVVHAGAELVPAVVVDGVKGGAEDGVGHSLVCNKINEHLSKQWLLSIIP